MNVGELRVDLANLDANLTVVMAVRDGRSVGSNIVHQVTLDQAYVPADGSCVLTPVVILE